MKRFIALLAVALMATTNICSAQGGLNEIRFRGWGEKEWNDNDYIRELRSYIDACARGEVDEYREEVVGYEVRYVMPSDQTSILSKEEILQLIKENQSHKLW